MINSHMLFIADYPGLCPEVDPLQFRIIGPQYPGGGAKIWPIYHRPMRSSPHTLIADKDPIFSESICRPLSGRLKSARADASLAAIMVGRVPLEMADGRHDFWDALAKMWSTHRLDFRLFSRTLIAAKDTLFLKPFTPHQD